MPMPPSRCRRPSSAAPARATVVPGYRRVRSLLALAAILAYAFPAPYVAAAFVKPGTPASMCSTAVAAARSPPSKAVVSTRTLARRSNAVVLSAGEKSPHGDDTSSSPREASEREIRRYKNRAALLERTLRDKMSELKRARNRAAVLRDVASRLKAANANVTSRLKEDTESVAEEAAAAAREEAESRLGREIASLRTELDEEREGRVQASVRYDALVDRMEEREMDYMSERDRAQREAEEAERSLKSELRAMRRGRDEANRDGAEARDALADAREEVRELEERFGRSEAEQGKIARMLDEREVELKALAQEERSKRQRLKEELAAARAAQQEAEEAAAAAAVMTPKVEEVTKKMQEEDELATIAAASVRAAESRESDALSRLDRVSAELRAALEERESAEALLCEAAKERDAALRRLEALRKSNDERGVRLTERLERAEDDAKRLEAEVVLLAMERDGARDTLMDERVGHWAKLREEQTKYDRAVLEEREGHEKQLGELRDRLMRAEAVAGRGGVIVESSGVNDTLSWADWRSRGQDGREPTPTEASRLTRVWRRIRSPRSWFSSREKQ